MCMYKVGRPKRKEECDHVGIFHTIVMKNIFTTARII